MFCAALYSKLHCHSEQTRQRHGDLEFRSNIPKPGQLPMLGHSFYRGTRLPTRYFRNSDLDQEPFRTNPDPTALDAASDNGYLILNSKLQENTGSRRHSTRSKHKDSLVQYCRYPIPIWKFQRYIMYFIRGFPRKKADFFDNEHKTVGQNWSIWADLDLHR